MPKFKGNTSGTSVFEQSSCLSDMLNLKQPKNIFIQFWLNFHTRVKTCQPKHFLHALHLFLVRWFEKLSFAAVVVDGQSLKCEFEFIVEWNPGPCLCSQVSNPMPVAAIPNFLINFGPIPSSCANEWLFKILYNI